ncbi:snRNA-activating protein complex subunit 4 [Ctenodactylus gundi]
MDIDAEREKITKEIRELERILDPRSSSLHLGVSESSLDSDSEADSLSSEDLDATGPSVLDGERWSEASSSEADPKDRPFPEDPETCLQLNMVYQEVIQEKLAEVTLLLAQNREQQEETLWGLSGSKGPRMKDGKSLPPAMYMGHFMKPYFKDKVTGVGPPANEDTREKAAQGVKAFEELLVTKWKHWEKALLRKSVVSDRLQRLLQPKLLRLEYLRQKQRQASSEPDKQALEGQIKGTEKEIQDINQLPEEALLGNRLDSHDWEKISNVSFEGGRSPEEIRKFWQNSEHPSINKQEWNMEEVERLKTIAAAHGHLEWQLVAEELGTRRSAFQCLQKFQQHNKALTRREWTAEEDRMLTQLVQAMRIGSHIPYRRIVYYMDGRDSMQLIYRWTKSLDPGLKKGVWAPDEDAKLLRAVAKYGEQDWFKIREEVPGRSDAQCRDRYLRRLHFSLKKGRWTAKEEEQLLELIEKYGAGHWAKIASELPHRSDSQCLSKWKIMVEKKQGPQRRRRKPRRRIQWSSSSSSDSASGDSGGGSSSSISSSDSSEAELEEPHEGGQVPSSAQYVVPSMDLWVPARRGPIQPWRGGPRGCPGHPTPSPDPPEGPHSTQACSREAPTTALAAGEERSQAQAPHWAHSTILRCGQPSHTEDAHFTSLEEPACKDGQCLRKVPMETVLRVLRTNTATQSHVLKERPRQLPLTASHLGPGPDDSQARRPLQQLWRGAFPNGQQARRHRRRTLHRRLLEHRLLLAMTPWVGDITLPCTQAPQRSTEVQTQADSIRLQLERARLASTPVFTLYMQLLQIDTAGCMEVVRERKAQPSTLPPPGTLNPRLHLQTPSGAQSMPARDTTKSTSHRGSLGPKSSQAEPATPGTPARAPGGPKPMPKTVSQLLREKRLREARARKTAQVPVVLAPQLLLSSAVVLQHPLPTEPTSSSTELSGLATPAATGPGPSESWQAAKTEIRPTPQALPLVPALSSGQVPAGYPLSSLGQSQAPTTSRKQGLPEVLPFLPASPSPAQLPMQPLSLTPALGLPNGGPAPAPSIPLPVTWVLTAQGLLPVSLPSVVGLPRPVELPRPTALSAPPQASSSETPACPGQPPARTDTEPAPSSGTDASGSPLCSPPQCSMEVGDVPCVPREAQVGKSSSQAKPPEAEPPWPGQLPTSSATGSRSDSGGTAERLPRPGPEKGTPDLGLLCLESEAAAREWLRGRQGACVPPLESRLPYQPPTLCSLRALSGLLLCRAVLEHQASSLAPGGEPGASRALVQRRLRDNPAYLLLKARFLAAFTLPAFLATLPPCGVPTTLTAATGEAASTDEELLRELGLDGDRAPAGRAASPVQGTPDSGKAFVPSCLDTLDDLDVLSTRHARHARKRRRLPMRTPVALKPTPAASKRQATAIPRGSGQSMELLAHAPLGAGSVSQTPVDSQQGSIASRARRDAECVCVWPVLSALRDSSAAQAAVRAVASPAGRTEPAAQKGGRPGPRQGMRKSCRAQLPRTPPAILLLALAWTPAKRPFRGWAGAASAALGHLWVWRAEAREGALTPEAFLCLRLIGDRKLKLRAATEQGSGLGKGERGSCGAVVPMLPLPFGELGTE